MQAQFSMAAAGMHKGELSQVGGILCILIPSLRIWHLFPDVIKTKQVMGMGVGVGQKTRSSPRPVLPLATIDFKRANFALSF